MSSILPELHFLTLVSPWAFFCNIVHKGIWKVNPADKSVWYHCIAMSLLFPNKSHVWRLNMANFKIADLQWNA